MSDHHGRTVAGRDGGVAAMQINGSATAMNGTNGTNRTSGMSMHGPGDQHLDTPLDAERRRLEAEIEAAEARTAAAERRAGDITRALHAVVVRSQEELAEIEASHHRTIEAIRTRARHEVERIIAEAQQLVNVHVRPAVDGAADGRSRGHE